MALSNLFGWKKSETEAGSACGAADKPAEKPAACGTACGAADKPEGSNRPGDDCFERTGETGSMRNSMWSSRQAGRKISSMRNSMWSI